MKKVSTKPRWLFAIPLLAAAALFAPATAGAAPVCATVKLELQQKATLEREAFKARLAIINNMPDKVLENLRVDIINTDSASGLPAENLFFTKITDLQNTGAVDGTGNVAPEAEAVIQWLIIPSTGAGGNNMAGHQYGIKALVSYTVDGVAQSMATYDSYISVKPQPVLRLEYMLPFEVFSDEPLTDAEEPVEPFQLGLRVTNVGYGAARNFKLNSGQPKIVENKKGLLLDIKLLGTQVNGSIIPDTLLLPFGDIAPNGVKTGAWIMATSLSGRFIEFSSTFTHAAELGGALTSLIESVTTYTLLKDVLVDIPGRDQAFDFLVSTQTPRSVLETMFKSGEELVPDVILESDQPAPIAVRHAASQLLGTLSGTNSSLMLRRTEEFPASSWIHHSVPFTLGSSVTLAGVWRPDGKEINPKNAWIARHFNQTALTYSYYLHVLDYNVAPGDYVLNFSAQELDVPPGAVTDMHAATGGEGGQLDLDWTATGEDGNEGSILGGRYLISLEEDPAFVFVSTAAQVNFFTNTTPGQRKDRQVSGLIGNTTYYLRLWTQDTGGAMSDLSNAATGYTLPHPPYFNSWSGVWTSSLTVSWVYGNNRSPITYELAIASGASLPVLASTAGLDGSVLQHNFTELVPNTTYWIRGSAVNPDSGVLSSVSVLSSTHTPAAVPGGGALSNVTPVSVDLTWGANGNPAGTGYRVEASSDDFATVPDQALFSETAVTFPDLQSGTSYSFRVQAVGMDGIPTAFTALGSTTTLGRMPASIVFAVVGSTGAQAYWDPNGNQEGALYTAQLSADGFVTTASSVTVSTSAAFAGLAPNTVYQLRVQAMGGSFAGPVSTTTLAAQPAAPAYTGLTSSSAALGWDGNGNPAGTVYLAQTSTDSFATLSGSSQTSNASAEFAGLTPNTIYQVRVSALNSAGTPTEFTAPVSTITLAAAPAAGDFTAVSTAALTGNWTASGNPADTLYLAQVSTDSFVTLLASSQTADVNAVFPDLTPNTIYQLRVQAFNSAGTPTEFTQLGSTATLAAAPAQTVLLAVTSSTINLDWAPNGNPEPGTSYQVWRDTDAAFGQPVYAAVSTTDYTVDGLSASTSYYFKTRALNVSGVFSAFDSAVSTFTLPMPPGQPAVPSGFTLGVSSINWTWEQLAGAAGYNVYPATDTSAPVGSSADPGFMQAGLTPNTTYSIMTGGLNVSGAGPLSEAGTPVWTFANPPAASTAAAVYITSAAIAWGLNGNPAFTVAELERSTDNISFTGIFSGPGAGYTDPGLQGCTGYYYRVRNVSGAGIATIYDSAPQIFTLSFPPEPPGNLYAESLAGNRIILTWEPSPTEEAAGYSLYYDSGTGVIDYGAPLAVVVSTGTTYITPVLVSSAAYQFGLRAKNSCGQEEGNTGVLASAASLSSLVGVRAAIKIPQTGKRVSGNRVTVVAELVLGAEGQTRQVLFQYKASSVAAWNDIPAATLSHPNPDAGSPYLVHWDVSGLAPANYDLRAVAMDAQSSSDEYSPSITVSVDPLNPDINETSQGGGSVKKEQKISNTVANTLQAADEVSGQLTKLEIPAGALAASTMTLSVTNSPAQVPPAPPDAQACGVVVEVSLSNGQTQLSGGKTAAITFGFEDAGNDGIVDGTALRVDSLQIYSAESLAGPWRRDFGSSLNLANKTVTGNTPHFSFFGLFSLSVSGFSSPVVYPVPFMPNDNNADSGVAYSASDANSGIIFDGLPSPVSIKIYTVTGQLVAKLSSGSASGRLQWDVKNGSGKDVASGVYLAVISSPGHKSVTKKVVVAR